MERELVFTGPFNKLKLQGKRNMALKKKAGKGKRVFFRGR